MGYLDGYLISDRKPFRRFVTVITEHSIPVNFFLGFYPCPKVATIESSSVDQALANVESRLPSCDYSVPILWAMPPAESKQDVFTCLGFLAGDSLQ